MIDDLESDPVELSRGVPQGSVLGPVLFNLYTSPQGDICKSHDIKYHQYTNDTQNYFSFKPAISGDNMHCIRTLQNCIKDIRIWMCTNMLKLNDNKTEFLVIGTKQQLSKVGDLSIQIGQDKINSSAYMRNLGFCFDQNMKNTAHVNRLSSSLYVTMKNISRIHHLIDNKATKTLIQMLVLSHLDYCNSVQLGSTKYNLNKLQMIQNGM